ncbi:MAG TPA: FprA family A-type flavoprotein [Acholeplasmataceae bacterium]|nr:FprA family A-type flavoprotein [Acholeplasmataceae bacterium]
MSVLKLTNRIYSVGVINPNLRIFDVIMVTEYGTTYNAYVVKGDSKTALIDAVHETFWDDHLANLYEVVDLATVDYLFCNHTEPDHSGSIKKILEINPNIQIVASAAGIKNIKSIINQEFNGIVAKDNMVFDLGGVTLKTIIAPMLHWPDSIFTWCEEEKVLFSCDFLSAHYCEPRMFDDLVTYPKKYYQAVKEYFDAIFSPFKSFVLDGLNKIKDLDMQLVATSHGPILRSNIQNIMLKYEKWSMQKSYEGKKALILYVTSYGYTRQIADYIQDHLENNYHLDVESYNVIEHDMRMFGEKIEEADILLIGSPTINRDALKPIWDVTGLISPFTNKGKPALVFGSYGWSGEGVPMIVERLKGLRLNVVGEGVKVVFRPNQKEFAEIKQAVDELMKEVSK